MKVGFSSDYFFPKNIDEASELALRYGEDACFIAGGTDLWLRKDNSSHQIKKFIDITRIDALKDISISENHIEIGSAVTYSQILNSNKLYEMVPFLLDAIRTIGSVQIRNVATLIGNITNASPAGDSLPPLYVLDSDVHIFGLRGTRTVSINDFILGVRKTALNKGELVTHISFDVPKSSWNGVFEKLGLRRAMIISVVNFAALLIIAKGKVKEARLALGAVSPTIIRASSAESFLVGCALDNKTIEKVALIASKVVKPIDDVRASSHYRRLAVQGLIRRGLMNLRSKRDIGDEYAGFKNEC